MSVKKIITAAVATMAALGIAASVQPNGQASASRRSAKSCSPARPGAWYRRTRRHARCRYRRTYRRIRYRRHARRRVRRHVARRRYRKHYTRKRRARRKPARKIRRRALHHSNENSDNDASDSNNDSNNSSYNDNESTAEKESEAEARTLQDINNDRIQNGLAPVQESQALNKIAKIRSNQTGQVYNKYGININNQEAHYDPVTNESLLNEVGEKLGYNNSEASGPYSGENADASNCEGPDNAADNMNDIMMNHDACANWGHRDNILRTQSTYVGIGVTYNPSWQYPYSLAEDFSYTDPGTPENIQNEKNSAATYNNIVNNHLAPTTISFGPNGQEHDSYGQNWNAIDASQGIHTYAGN